MIDITASAELIRWAVDHVVKIVPEILGGFIAYCLHLAYHEVWKKPGHFITRRILRRTRKEL